jgi:hypothetical protein
MKKQLSITRTARQRLLELLKITSVTLLLFVLVDVFFGAWVMSLVRPSDTFRVRHPIYHHSLKPNFDGIGYWGSWTYRVCTDANGFKTQCEKKNKANPKVFDIAFLGDSFTEGVGLPYEQTFVGMVATKTPELNIANLGAVSYSPAIYLAKLKALYAKGYQFKHLIVFIDIGDVYDEANAYDLYDDAVVVDKGERYPLSFAHQLRRSVAQYLPLTVEGWTQINKLGASKSSVTARVPLGIPFGAATSEAALKQTTGTVAPAAPVSTDNSAPTQPRQNSVDSTLLAATSPTPNSQAPFIKNIYEGVYLKDYPKSEWTYNSQSTHYGVDGVNGTLSKMKKEMQALYTLAQSHGTKLSIGVYPWPGQIKHDVVESQQVKIWREFCESRCAHFYNTFPSFFSLAQQQGAENFIYSYYFQGDVHFNERGNEIIARLLLDAGVQ